MSESKFIMLVGLPASGKSTVAQDLMGGRDDTVYISSDDIRVELTGDVNNQDINGQVFSEMAIRTKNALKERKNVIYDATNINRKKRIGLLRQLPKNVEKIALYVATPYEEVLRRNMNRERKVPTYVIDNMYKNMQIPIYSEGWSKIVFEYTDEIIETDLPKQFTDAVRAGVLLGREGYELMSFMATYFDDYFKIYDMPQDSKWHSLSVSRHIYYVYKHVLDNYQGEDKELMLWTALLHDIGKAFCKTFISRKGEEMRYAQFIGHEYVGSQIAVNLLKQMNFEDRFIEDVALLIQFHMYLLDENANREKLKERVGKDFYNKLEILREADTLSH